MASLRARLVVLLAAALLPLAMLAAWQGPGLPDGAPPGRTFVAMSRDMRGALERAAAALRQQAQDARLATMPCAPALSAVAAVGGAGFASVAGKDLHLCPTAEVAGEAMAALGRLGRDVAGTAGVTVGMPTPGADGRSLLVPLAVAGASGTGAAATWLALRAPPAIGPALSSLAVAWQGAGGTLFCDLAAGASAANATRGASRLSCREQPPGPAVCGGDPATGVSGGAAALAGDRAVCLSTPIAPSLTLLAFASPLPPPTGSVRSRFQPWRPVLAAALFAAALLAAAMTATVLVTLPMRRLTGAVSTWRARGVFPVGGDKLPSAEWGELEGAFSQATWRLREGEAKLERALSQHELLMKEIHHRVKNNLQIVASLLNLQAGRIKQPEARAEFQAARDRVRALATLHRHLYGQGELHTIEMRDFLEELCDQLFQAMGETRGHRITLSIEATSVQVSSDQAVPISLIVTEAVSNALKYAFPEGRSGHVSVRFAVKDGEAELVVEDDGIGLPPGRVETETGPRDGLGLPLIRGFARQLRAILMVDHTAGTRYTVRLRLAQAHEAEEPA